MFVTKDNELIMKKQDILEKELDLLEHLRDSYDKYVEEGYKADANYILHKLEELLDKEFISKSCDLKHLTGEDHQTVIIKFSYNTDRSIESREYKAYTIPIINNRGVFKIDGQERVFRNVLTKMEDLSETPKKDGIIEYQLKTADNSLNFANTSNNFTINYKGINATVTLAALAVYIGMLEGKLNIDSNSTEDAYNYILDNYSSFRMLRMNAKGVQHQMVRTIVRSILPMFERIKLTDLELGRARASLNEYFSFDKLDGCTLAFDVDGLTAGTVLTKDNIPQIKSDKLYIRYKPDLANLYTAFSNMTVTVPAGTKVTPKLLNLKPELKGMGYVKEAFVVTLGNSKEKLTSEDVEFFYSLNIPSIEVTTAQGGKPIEAKFYKEVIRNTSSRDSKTLTLEDVRCLISHLLGLYELPEVYKAYKRDIDFLKVINTFGDSVSETVRKRFDKMCSSINNAGSNFRDKILTYGTASENFFYLSRSLYSELFSASVTALPNYQNPSSLIYGSRVVASLVGAKEAPMTMRSILMAHYGRVCPFDTPQGEKIGLVNSLALRCKVEDGIPLSPYHPIIKKGGRYYISREIKYLSPKDERKYKIGSILDLQHDDPNASVFDSPIIETPIMARVPAVRTRTEESMTVESIMLSELDYVSVYEDQLISLNVALIPFVGSDDGPRLTFAASMMRQSVPILRSQKPRIYTSIYKDLVNEAEYVVRANTEGTVVSDLPDEYITVRDKDGTRRDIEITKSHNFGSSLIVMDTRVKSGDKVKEGDIVADTILSRDGMYSPGRNVLIAYMPWYGWNYDDSIVLSRKAASNFCSPIMNKLEAVLPNNGENHWSYIQQVPNESYASENTSIVRISSVRASETKYIAATLAASGIVQNVYKTVDTEDDKLTVTVKLLDIEELHQGDKMAGRHGNKGVVSRIEPNSTMPSFKNGEIIDVLQNPCGIGSRMNPGQLLEAQLGFVCYLLDLEIRSNSFNGASTQEIRDLVKFCWEVCNTDDSNPEAILAKYDYPDIIKDAVRNRFDYLQEWKDCFFPDGTAYLINNRTGQLTEEPVLIGCVYYLKLEHEVNHKRNERKGIVDSSYTQISKQPKTGASVKGGQTIGEMEIWAIASHGATEVLAEALHDKSDNTYLREEMKKAISRGGNYEHNVDYYKTAGTATEQFRYIVEAMGGYIDTDVGTDLSLNSILNQAHKTNIVSCDISDFDDIPE